MGEQQLKTSKDFKGDRPCKYYWVDKCCQNKPLIK